MSLATRCPSCSTVFRVVQDQLRVSEGWVRCGRCGEAFNALEAMVTWPPPQAPAAPVIAPETAAAAEPDPATDESAKTDVAAIAATPPEPAAEIPEFAAPSDPVPFAPPAGVAFVTSDGAVAPQAAHAPTSDVVTEGADASARSDEAHAPDDEDQARPEREERREEQAGDGSEGQRRTRRRESSAMPAPSFVKQADRAARWRRPWVRAGLSLLLLLAMLGLAGQAAYAFRARLAAGHPLARAFLLQACARLNCRVDDYRDIDALVVESSDLTPMSGAALYRLSLTLRNRATVEVAAPALDLAVTDAQGRQIARRMLTMPDLSLPLRTLRPGSELPITAPLAIDGQVSGYTVEIFYP